MTDTYRGERVVKERGTRYLPATSGMMQRGFPQIDSIGSKMYNAYRVRAIFHEFVKEAVKTLTGIMHHKPATIELPAIMEPMRENATVKGESLDMLLRRVNQNQLIAGRYGLLADLPAERVIGTVLPYLATYKASTIINWDDGRREDPVVQALNLVVLDESEDERQADFSWEREEKYRVLVLGDPTDNEPRGSSVYRAGTFRDTNTFDEAALMTPVLRGAALDRIPFAFINSVDVVPEPDDPPLLGLAKLALAIYRGEADYRQGLFMQGQDTLVVIGDKPQEGNADLRDNTYNIGAGASINLPAGQGVDAKFIGVESGGLAEQREAIVNDKKDAATLAGQLMDNTARGVESGDALQMRVAARTATLNSIALTGAFGVQKVLRDVAAWLGADPEEVVVQPNLDFADERLEGKTLVDYMTAKMLGAPLSLESVHRLMQDRGLTQEEFEEELRKIEEEEPLVEPPTRDAFPEQDES